MTAFDRFETRLPDLMTELAQASSPDYVADLLRQTARTRQRPAWSALERWLPMGAIARTLLPVRSLPWRPILIAGLLLALLGGALALYIGTPEPLPAPFGPAANGALLVSGPNGDIVSVDVTTGATTPVLAKAGIAVSFSSSGQWFYYDATTTGAPAIFVAKADGTESHKVWSGPMDTTWIDWSQDGTRLVTAAHSTSGTTTVHLVDAKTGADATATFDHRFTSVAQPYGSRSLVMVSEAEGQPTTYYVANDDGTGLRALAADHPVAFPSLSADGTRIVYTSWQDGIRKQGRLHVLDLATGSDSEVPSDTNIRASTIFSPDGKYVATQRFTPGANDYDIEILAIDAQSLPIVLGTKHSGANGARASFAYSPDGAKVIVRYGDDSMAWLFAATGGTGQPLPGITTEFFSWQRAGE
jgi:Tol biopolymer transport system component